MNVLLVNTSHNIGGAAIACSRLMDALMRNGIEVRLLVAPRRRGFLCKAFERIMMLPFVRWSWRKSWTIDVNWLGTDITKTDDFRWADVIHLHWVNQGMLSVEQIGRIAHSGKRVVWTMHDLWPLESIYHYTPSDADSRYPWLERSTMQRKLKAYGAAGIRFVTCSHWLQRQAESSLLLQGNSICSIPNPIDTTLFRRTSRIAARKQLGIETDCRLVLFVSQKLTDERKGARYFIEAVNRMEGDVSVAVLGSGGEDIARELHCKTYVLGYVSDKTTIVAAYNAADVFVLPSLNDNLPNTIMEAMACGVPCVGFDIGGIPEMIHHLHTGYVARPRDAEDLKQGIAYSISPDNSYRLSEACIRKVEETYSQAAVAKRFAQLYK